MSGQNGAGVWDDAFHGLEEFGRGLGQTISGLEESVGELEQTITQDRSSVPTPGVTL